jgi:predicted flap endonuclease-1-like 5' DNA nuclease
MALFITELQGCTDLVAARLAEAGIIDSNQLLKACATRAQRHELAKHLEVEETLILALANRADLARIRGVAGVYADLMERAGVDTVRELAQRRADHLLEKVTAVNRADAVTQAPPTLKQVEKWIEQAKKLAPGLTY